MLISLPPSQFEKNNYGSLQVLFAFWTELKLEFKSGIVQQFWCVWLLIISEKGWYKCIGPQRAPEEKDSKRIKRSRRQNYHQRKAVAH